MVRLAYSFAPSPKLIGDIERIFRQEKPLKVLMGEAIDHIRSNILPPSDARASKEYREHLVEFGTAYLLKSLLGVEG